MASAPCGPKGLGRDEIATRALHSTSDFPQILAGVTNRTLREAHEVAPRTYQAIARRATVGFSASLVQAPCQKTA